MTAYVGIDVNKDKLDVLLVRDGYAAERRQFDNQRQGFSQLHHFLQQHPGQPVYTGLEAAGHAGDALATYLYDLGYTVSVITPAQLKTYADSHTKADTSTTALVVDYCRTQYPPTWTPPAPTAQDVQALARQLASLQQVSQPADNSGSSYWGRLLSRGRKSQPV